MTTPPKNSNWPTGYVPTALEWAQSQSSKVDYPAPLDQGGTGAQSASGANYLILQRGLISGSIEAALCVRYGIRTSMGAMTIDLPPLSKVLDGDWIDFADVDFEAATNNVTISAHGSEQIALYGVLANSQTLNVSGVRVTLIATPTYWSMIV